MRSTLFTAFVVAIVLGAATRAEAIPAFARRYGTSCQTCHIVFPKLSPFGEAFRRNGYKFPGKDEDFVKQEQIPLGQEAYREVFPDAVWPGTLPASPPLALGFNGAVTMHPSRSSGAAQADNRAVVSLEDLVAEGHLWAGGAFSEHIAYFAEVTFSRGDKTAEIEHAELHFNDLGLSPHLVNLFVGRGVPNLTSFAPHSSYIADTVLPMFGVTALFGGDPDSAFSTLGQYNLIELNGMAKGRFIYSLGVNSGANDAVRTTQNAYAHVGFKVGGLRLDGEGDRAGNPLKPWAETAFTLDAYGYRSVSNTFVAGDPTMPYVDLIYVLGVHARFTAGSFEVDAGAFQESHSQAAIGGLGVKALTQYDELSYVVYPWLVPAVRLEYVSLAPNDASRINDLRVLVGAAALVRPNLKLTLTGAIEHANAAPVAGWSADGSDRAAVPTTASVTEFESLELGLAYAY
jgi:hypothetical protein